MKTEESYLWQDKLEQLEVVVLIPTYNNGKTLANIIKHTGLYSKAIIVVNDGSTDNTASVLDCFPNIQVITHARNRGKGTTLKKGLSHARKAGFRYAITIDSDGQHFASDIPLFIEAIEKEPDTFLVGARNLTSDNMPGKNTFANKFSNFWFTLETGLKLEDTQSGFRLYPLRRINSDRFYYTAKYEFELEALVFSAWSGVKVKNIPIHVYYPPCEERISHFRPFRDFTRISILNTVLVLITFLWIRPRDFYRNKIRDNGKQILNTHVLHSKESNVKITLAVMLGIFMGIFPAWGYQMLITLFLAHIFKLNKVIAIIASNISLPPMIPFLLYGSYFTGCKILNKPMELELSNISLGNIKQVLGQYLIGSIVFAAICSLIVGGVTFGLLYTYRTTKRL